MKKETKEKSLELIEVGVAKIINNYTKYALLINSCDVASKSYETLTNPILLSTTLNIPESLRLDSFELDLQYNNQELVEEYRTKSLIIVFENYLIHSVSVVDGILEDLFEIMLKDDENIDNVEVEKNLSTAWRNDNLKNYLTTSKGVNLQKPTYMNMSFEETFIRYLELRIVRHAIIHTNSKLTEKDYNRLNDFAEQTPDERKNIALINSPMIKNKRIILSINGILAIRQFLDRFLMYFYNSIQQEVTN